MHVKQNESAFRKVEKSFRKKVRKDSKLKSAFILVHSGSKNIHLHVFEGLINSKQPVYMASVGKIFTSVIIGMLHENEQLNYDDEITKYLDVPLIENLHVYKGKDYTKQIKIKHLLNHTSGLHDNFYPLLDELLKNPNFNMTPEKVITWVKIHKKPHFTPGNGFKYSNTNYLLLGLIIEQITKMPFHEVLNQYIYEPIGMTQSSMLHHSKPSDEDTQHSADFYVDKKNIAHIKGYSALDFAGAGVVSTGKDLLKFMKALTTYKLVRKETLEKMMNDKAKYGVGIDYGYGIMQFRPVPILMPKIFNVWGHAGGTGAYMFYHPKLDIYAIGTFNDFSYERKGVRFMLGVIHQLSKYK